MTHENPFKTIYKGDYIWPYIVPTTYKAGKGPGWEDAEGPEAPPDPVKMCQCDRHDFSPHFKRAHHLREKELAFREAMLAVAAERTILDNELLEHPCINTEDALMSIYSSDYTKRLFPVADYRSMKKDHDDPVVSPVAMPKDPKTTAYRDCTPFKRVAIEPQAILGPRPVHFALAEEREDPPYLSEYMATISKDAMDNIIPGDKFQSVPSRDRKDTNTT